MNIASGIHGIIIKDITFMSWESQEKTVQCWKGAWLRNNGWKLPKCCIRHKSADLRSWENPKSAQRNPISKKILIILLKNDDKGKKSGKQRRKTTTLPIGEKQWEWQKILHQKP